MGGYKSFVTAKTFFLALFVEAGDVSMSMVDD